MVSLFYCGLAIMTSLSIPEDRRGTMEDLLTYRSFDILVIGALETHYDTAAVGAAGEQGVLQVMPDTTKWADEYLTCKSNTNYNGACYYNHLVKYYKGDRELAMAAYNSGPGRVNQYIKGGRPLPTITQKRLKDWRRLSRLKECKSEALQ